MSSKQQDGAHPGSAPVTLGVIGAGAMGRGIVQIALAAGLRVVLTDARPEACDEAASFVLDMLQRQVEKGKLAPDLLTQARNNLSIGSLDILEQFAGCDLVVEAIVERLDVKQELFARLESVVADHCILATNTSSLSVTAIASGCRLPGRVAGFHFFNPVPLMKVVEVIRGQLTEADTIESLLELAQRLGHCPVEVADMPGFLVNHAGRGYGTESLRILAEGVADVQTIDRILREQCGFRMGPFELFDLTGLDISHTVTESIYQQFYEDPRYRPSPITAQRMKAGLFGRKSGQGFYRYDDGAQQRGPEPAAVKAEPCAVWISSARPEAAAKLRDLLQQGSATLETGERPSERALCLVTPLGQDATTAALAEDLDPARTLAVDTLIGWDKRRVAMLTPATSPEYRDLARGLLAEDGVPVSIIGDSPGFIAQRVLAAIINIACEIAELQIATPADIDAAVQIGLGYPNGPLQWADQLGGAQVLALLENLQNSYGDPRYRPSLWLRRRAALGLPLGTLSTPLAPAAS